MFLSKGVVLKIRKWEDGKRKWVDGRAGKNLGFFRVLVSYLRYLGF